jgi:hypothetical protein
MDIIDAYFGPKEFSPRKVGKFPQVEELLLGLDRLIEKTRGIDEELRRIAITADLESLKVVVKWLSGENMSYLRLVEGVFGMTPMKFGRHEVRGAQEAVEAASAGLPGSNVSEKILRWREKSKITGAALRKLIKTEIVLRTVEIEELFRKRVFTHLQTKVENNGVVYKTATRKPWGGYNYYQGNYSSVNVFNVDRPTNKYGFISTLYHEYEHHVATLFVEKCYRERGLLDLAAILLNTKRCIIGEGTADCAREFLGLRFEECEELLEALRRLRDIISLNVAYMLNVENVDNDVAAEYVASERFLPIEDARKSIMFSMPLTPEGKPNLLKPYVYTYSFGRRDYVLSTFQKALKKDKVKEFFQTVYLNPYSRSTATWKKAFATI